METVSFIRVTQRNDKGFKVSTLIRVEHIASMADVHEMNLTDREMSVFRQAGLERGTLITFSTISMHEMPGIVVEENTDVLIDKINKALEMWRKGAE